MDAEGWPSFELSAIEEEDGSVRLRLEGELDITAAPAVERELVRRIEAGAIVRVDLSQLTFIDSSGLNALLKVTMRLGTGHRRIEFDPLVSGQVRQLLRLTGVESILWPDHDPSGDAQP